jgi:putative Mg2+ transporter-C (MgtC) family protein
MSSFPFLDSLRDLTLLSLIVRLLLSVVCGGIVGFDRGKTRHAAGLRTHILVCMGAAAVMIVNLYLVQVLQLSTDASRMGAQVVSGIGFLGAGSIIVTARSQVRGLTTAAGLWASACMGLAVGAGYYEGAIVMAILILFILSGINHLDQRYVKRPSSLSLYLEYDSRIRFSEILTHLHQMGHHVSSIDYPPNPLPDLVPLRLELRLHSRRDTIEQVLADIRSIPGVLYAADL